MSAARHAQQVAQDLLADLEKLADHWDAKYHELRGEREENETWQDEADDMLADAYSECAAEIRKRVIDTRSRL